MTDETDLFGPVSSQASLFGAGDNRLQAPQPQTLPDPAVVRRRLNTLLKTARSAKIMPWSERDVRMWQTVFPNMAKWLPDEEAAQLRFEFAQEIERLKRAA